MSGKNIVRTIKNKNYTVMSNVHLRDKNLSWKAKGIHSYILSLPDDWKIIINHLVAVSTDRESSTRSGLKELYDNRYWQKYPVYNDGKVDHWVTLISEIPFDENEVIKSIVHRDGVETINYKVDDKKLSTGKDENPKKKKKPIKNKNLLPENQQVGEPIDNAGVELLPENLNVGNLNIGNQGLLSTNNTKDLFITKDLVSQSKKDTTDKTLLLEKIKEQAQLDLYIFDEDRMLLEKALGRLLNTSSLKVNGEMVESGTIKEKLLQLRVEMCDYALGKYRQALRGNSDIKNKLQYFCVLLYNSIDEYYAEIY